MLEGCSASAGAEEKYTASVKGCHGDVTVKAVISKGKITSLEAEGPLETPSVGGLALKTLPGKIVEKNGLSVDAIAGATMTSTAIIKATGYCLTAAGVAVKLGPTAQTYKAGTYTAKYKGHMGPVPVSVTFSDSKIEKIEVGKNDETPHLVAGASTLLGNQIIADQSLAVDSVSTATYSARAILSGVEDCVKQAGGKPAELKHPVLSNPKAGKDEEDSADIVIVGGGTSGSVALYRAASSDLNTITLSVRPDPSLIHSAETKPGASRTRGATFALTMAAFPSICAASPASRTTTANTGTLLRL
jgi:fumarate reductase flavoprotein subunit